MSPFDPWLLTYSAGTVAERPWWARADTLAPRFTRGDGVQIVSDNPDGEMEWIAYSGNDYRNRTALTRMKWPVDPGGPWKVLPVLMDEIDDAHPRPVPPLLVGQVWVGPNGDAMIIDFYTPEYPVMGLNLLPRMAPAWGLSVDKYVSHTGRCVLRSEVEMRAMLDGAVLVSGPHAPWAPRGWRP